MLLTLAVSLGLTGFAGSAEAAPNPTPNGYVGACNMLQDATMDTIPMVHNMTQNTNGNDGMFIAVVASGGCF